MESIELDCPPGNPRPGDLIEGVIAGTGLTLTEPSKLFGNWTWTFDVPHEQWVETVQPVIKPRIEALYHQGYIRYGSW
jgi:hypothetical protein